MYRPVHKAVPGRPFKTFVRYNMPFWWDYLRGGLLGVFFIAVELLLPWVIRQVVHQFNTATMTARMLWSYFLALIVIAVVSGVARYFQRMLMIGASRKFEYDLRNDYFRHIQLMSQRFFSRWKTGDIMARATNDLNYVRMFIGPGIMGSFNLLRVPAAIGLMVYFSPRLTLIALMPLPVVSLLVYFFVMYMHRQSKVVQEQFSVVTGRAQENLAGARVVQAYGVADRELRDFTAESDKYMREGMRLAVVMSLAHPLIELMVGATALLVLWRGGLMVINGNLLFADFSGFIVCLLMLAWPLVEFGWVLTLYQRGAVAMNRITEVLAVEPAIRDTSRTRQDIDAVRGGIRFENVSFAYQDEAVLHDLDFEVLQGQTLAIVGKTGSGKSSVVALMTREYDPAQGRVLIDGIDARDIPVQILRGAIGYVPQDTFLFSDTILENLTFGRPDASEDDIRHAAEVAQFSEVVGDLPHAYDTLLGERGVNLSGGQKQRLAIARAVVRDPSILILDDALSSVDTHTEEEILQRLRRVMATRTSVLISHRVSTVRHADQIIVLDEGRIAERGSHDELLAMGGLYSDMYERQLLEEEIEEQR